MFTGEAAFLFAYRELLPPFYIFVIPLTEAAFLFAYRELLPPFYIFVIPLTSVTC